MCVGGKRFFFDGVFVLCNGVFDFLFRLMRCSFLFPSLRFFLVVPSFLFFVCRGWCCCSKYVPSASVLLLMSSVFVELVRGLLLLIFLHRAFNQLPQFLLRSSFGRSRQILF